MILDYCIPFLLTFFGTVILTPFMRKYAVKKHIVDHPEKAPDRKIHSQAVPLLGGWSIFGVFSFFLITYTWCTDRILGGYMLEKYIIGILLGGAVLMIGGWIDDRYDIRASRQIIFPISSAIIIIACGIGVSYISNPFGNTLWLDIWNIELFHYNNLPYRIILPADFFAMLWMLGMMYTTKLLDGVDGVVSGVGGIGAVIIFVLSITKEVAQPETALLASLLTGACFGFLVYNFHPAKIYLGESGALFIGFMLGLLAIISGGKIATALLIMGVPILDVAWTIIRRIRKGVSPFRVADKEHFHHRLLAAGLSQRQTAIFFYGITALFGIAAIVLKGQRKLIALGILCIFMFVLAKILIYMVQKRKHLKILTK